MALTSTPPARTALIAAPVRATWLRCWPVRGPVTTYCPAVSGPGADAADGAASPARASASAAGTASRERNRRELLMTGYLPFGSTRPLVARRGLLRDAHGRSRSRHDGPEPPA
ncbi:hypothetical protein ACFQY7_52050 [Actinomadura luteofluorescens]|uniref:hypothetical protein n=1 Tax=Actinomadura luteofluorescens TaxID=46163 RepID=UPI00362DE1E2